MHRGLKLFLVDDDDNDVALFRTAMAKARLPMSLHAVENGQQAIDALKHGHASDSGPDLIILDLRMPLRDGFEFLTWRQTSRFADVPVVVFTGLGDSSERERALRLGANLVLEKPLKFKELVEVVRMIGGFTAEHRKPAECPAGID